ncbi:magnesium transporter [Chloroflexota bacterium]
MSVLQVSLYVTGCYFVSLPQGDTTLRHRQSPGHIGCLLSSGLTHLRAGSPLHHTAFGSAGETILKRLPWLAINMVTLFIAVTVVDAFESVIAGLVALAVFLPLVSGEGGNAGSQIATVIVRGIALGEVSTADGKRALSKEVRVSLVNGALIGLATGIVAYIWKGDWRISVGILLAMILNFLMAAATGVLIPLGLKKINVDPALASAAFITGFTDTFGFLFFLGIVSLLV